MKIIFNVGILLNPAASKIYAEFASQINRVRKCQYLIGENSHAHVTLLQFAANLNAANDIWKSINKCQPTKAIHLEFKALAIDEWNGIQDLSLRCFKTKEISELQKKLSSELVYQGLSYLNGIDEQFDPHLTVAGWRSDSTLPPIKLESEWFQKFTSFGHLGLGVSGPKLQFETALLHRSGAVIRSFHFI